MGYSKKVIHTLLDHICIVNVISHYLNCERRARKNDIEYVALCPFHSEKTPSLTITKAKQFYHCFGCGAHGNAIEFVMEYTGLDFISATKQVAEIGKFHLPNGPRPSKKKIRDRKRFLKRKHRSKLLKTEDKKRKDYSTSGTPF